MSEKRRTTIEEAKRVGDEIGVDWSRFDLEQFRHGMDVEFEHGSHDPQADVTHDDPIVTGKIALAHMKEFPDYYERLEQMEAEAEREWAAQGVLNALVGAPAVLCVDPGAGLTGECRCVLSLPGTSRSCGCRSRRSRARGARASAATVAASRKRRTDDSQRYGGGQMRSDPL
jgi:hypothetical protein